MAYKLVCTAPMHRYKKGQVVTDQAEIARLLLKHGHHFVKTMMPEAPAPAPAVEQPTKSGK
jgi:hypothetical protein